MCFVGDNVKKDFIVPEMLGMKCIWFRNKDDCITVGEGGNKSAHLSISQ